MDLIGGAVLMTQGTRSSATITSRSPWAKQLTLLVSTAFLCATSSAAQSARSSQILSPAQIQVIKNRMTDFLLAMQRRDFAAIVAGAANHQRILARNRAEFPKTMWKQSELKYISDFADSVRGHRWQTCASCEQLWQFFGFDATVSVLEVRADSTSPGLATLFVSVRFASPESAAILDGRIVKESLLRIQTDSSGLFHDFERIKSADRFWDNPPPRVVGIRWGGQMALYYTGGTPPIDFLDSKCGDVRVIEEPATRFTIAALSRPPGRIPLAVVGEHRPPDVLTCSFTIRDASQRAHVVLFDVEWPVSYVGQCWMRSSIYKAGIWAISLNGFRFGCESPVMELKEGGASDPATSRPASTTVTPAALPPATSADGDNVATLLTRVIPGGRLGAFKHGTKVTGCYSTTQLIDIQPRGVSFAQKCIRTRLLVHAGVDIVAPKGAEVHPLASGTVIDVIATASDLSFKSLGYAVLLQHTTPSNNKPTWSLYLHLDQPPAVDPGDQVTAGQTVLGYVGQTGAAFGPHTHLEVRHFPERVSPKWRNVYGVEAPTAQGGTFDPALFAEDWEDPAPLLQAAVSPEGVAGAGAEVGSSSSIAGSYALRSVNGQPLPYNLGKTGTNTNEWVGDIITIADDGTYTQMSTVRSTRAGTSIKKESGTWVRNGASITLRPTSNSTQPPASGTLSGGTVTLLSRGYTLIYGN
jgi:hypothetical protein